MIHFLSLLVTATTFLRLKLFGCELQKSPGVASLPRERAARAPDRWRGSPARARTDSESSSGSLHPSKQRSSRAITTAGTRARASAFARCRWAAALAPRAARGAPFPFPLLSRCLVVRRRSSRSLGAGCRDRERAAGDRAREGEKMETAAEPAGLRLNTLSNPGKGEPSACLRE